MTPTTFTMMPRADAFMWQAERDSSTSFNRRMRTTTSFYPRYPRHWAPGQPDILAKEGRARTASTCGSSACGPWRRSVDLYRRRLKIEDLTKMHEGKSQLRILVVEDEAKVARALREGLEREKYEVVVAPTGEEGFFLVNAEEFDLVILDLMLPGRDGLQVLATLRKRGLQTPVLILTARDAVEDRVAGLDKGADDYLVKPFAFPELLARVRALLRRTEQGPQL